jgi:hypothetical protein
MGIIKSWLFHLYAVDTPCIKYRVASPYCHRL